MSTQKAAMNLGMNVMVLNIDKEGWALELRDGVVMNGTTVEHIREAAAVIGQYVDILGLRSFPGLQNRDEDYGEVIFNKFVELCGVPVVSLESATRHPLQSLADLITIEELKTKPRPKVVLTWAPHVKALRKLFRILLPNGCAKRMLILQLCIRLVWNFLPSVTKGANITHNQTEALQDADFIYVKNWSAFEPYGKVIPGNEDWMMTNAKLKTPTTLK